jgi:hypothetical protein
MKYSDYYFDYSDMYDSTDSNCTLLNQGFLYHIQETLIPINYLIIFMSFIISIVLLVVTFFCDIPGRIFRVFVYNTYGLNLIFLLGFACFNMTVDMKIPNLEFVQIIDSITGMM